MKNTPFELPALPYGYDFLEPVISRETLGFHHDKHHRGYVEKLNELVGDSDFRGKTLEEIVLRAKGPLFNNAAQHWNHSFYWNCMTTRGEREPRRELRRAMDRAFGSFEAFQAEFEKQASAHFGSGWAWLVYDEARQPRIEVTHDAENPLRQGLHPILVCDLWEHAYYIDYRNDRKKYLKEFWKVAHWEFAEKNFGQS